MNSSNTKLQKECFEATIISSLFSYGADTKKPELRATEIKALMRHTFRIASCIEDCTLYKEESILFGNTDGASPIAVQLKSRKVLREKVQLMLHANKINEPRLNPAKACYKSSSTFDIILRAKPDVEKEIFQKWCNILQLSLILGGIGQRSRRGRGSIILNQHLPRNKKDLINSVLNHLNNSTFAP